MPKAPPGNVGKKVTAHTNGYELTWKRPTHNSGEVYHYDVISPSWQNTREIKIGKVKGTELLMRLQDKIAPQLFNPRGVYDGKKNLFSFRRYDFESQKFEVPWNGIPSNRPKDVQIQVTFVKKIDVGTLHRLINGDPGSIRPESDASTAINMLNLFVQSTPRMTAPMIFNAKSFFTPLDKRTSQKIQPLELWRGHFQSVRPTLGKMIVNVDTTIGVILPARNLESICGDILHLRNIRDLGSQMDHIPRLRSFLKNVKIEIDLPGHAGRTPKTIKDVLPNVGEISFDKGGEMITVGEHFARTHNYTIRSRSLGVKLGSAGTFPMSVCKTVQQLYKNRSSPDVVREALEFSTKNPRERLNAIRAGWQELKYDQSYFLVQSGISINPTPLSVRGRILPSPRIVFGGNEVLQLQRSGAWDVMRKQFTRPAHLKFWTVVDFANADHQTLVTFVNDLKQCMIERGMVVAEPCGVARKNLHSNIKDVLTDEGRRAKAQLMVVILPESAPQPYNDVKRFGDVTQGVSTQCVRWTRKLAGDVQQKRANQYQNNLILKINAKLGGVNCAPTDSYMENATKVPTMIIGADVSHPGPGSHLPSISAMVSSTDRMFCRYIASIRVQKRRAEIIEDFSQMFYSALKRFEEANSPEPSKPVRPQNIFVFRDGVSEGEFQTVKDQEITAIKDVLPKVYGPDPNRWPRLTFIVVGKRHHVRFFGDHASEDPKGNGNLPSGFVVDQDIIHPVHQDFYLQSQPGLKGTSRPSHYTVLRNDLNLTSDQLQGFAYALCHCYSRSTRSVKIPAPVYYADLVCRRAKFHFDNLDNLDDMSSVASENEDQQLDYFRQHFDETNERVKRSMYFV